VLPGSKIPALTTNRILYRDGIAVATWSGGDVQWIETLAPAEARVAEQVLAKRQTGSPLLAYLR
jgi:ATP-dependent Lhr-like helicase